MRIAYSCFMRKEHPLSKYRVVVIFRTGIFYPLPVFLFNIIVKPFLFFNGIIHLWRYLNNLLLINQLKLTKIMAQENAKQEIGITDLNLKGNVIVKLHPETGAIYTVKNNLEWCSVRVESMTLGNNEKGLLVLQKRVGFIRMQVIVADSLIAQGLLKAEKPFPMKGKIVIKESWEEFYPCQVPKVNPQTGEVITYMGKDVYRVTYFQSGEHAHDELIADYARRMEVEMRDFEPEEVVEQVSFPEFMQKEFAA